VGGSTDGAVAQTMGYRASGRQEGFSPSGPLTLLIQHWSLELQAVGKLNEDAYSEMLSLRSN